MRLNLIPHPDTPCAAIDAIEVQVRRAGGTLDLHYFAHGRVGEVLWPVDAEPGRADRLWETSCFEAFVQPEGRAGYAEFNFAPSGAWQAYAFTGYRAGMALARGMAAPLVRMRMTERTRVHHVTLEPGAIPGIPGDAAWRLGLSAVIEEANGTKSYWALHHPPGKPDFHAGDCFRCLLAPPEAL